MEVEPLVVNEFVDDITPALLPEVPFVSILCTLTAFFCLDKHPEKAQQLPFIDSLMGCKEMHIVMISRKHYVCAVTNFIAYDRCSIDTPY
jgi:hypothetical protein